MTTMLKRFVELRTLPHQPVHTQDLRPFDLPPRAYADQDQSSLLAGLGGASLGRCGYGLIVPPVHLLHAVVDNGVFFVGHRLDGTVVTSDGHPIIQTAAFRDRHEAGQQDETLVDAGPVQELDEVFLGFDGAWRNYFHWLCFALVKSFIGARRLDPSVMIVLPDYASNTTERPASFSQVVYDQCLEDSGLADRVTRLAPGAYRARRIHLFWTNPGEPTDIMHLDAFRDVFDAISTTVRGSAEVVSENDSTKIYLARSRFVASRLDDRVAEMIDAAALRHGFEKVGFEGLDLRQQVSIINRATHLISPHGAGLTNILFNRGTLNVLELNKPLDGGSSLRPWFLLAARARKLDYRYLDTAASGFTPGRLDAALTMFAEL